MILALAIYGEYLMGQMSGMSEVLNLPSVVSAFDIEAIPQPERPELTQDLLLIHSQVIKIVKSRERRPRRG